MNIYNINSSVGKIGVTLMSVNGVTGVYYDSGLLTAQKTDRRKENLNNVFNDGQTNDLTQKIQQFIENAKSSAKTEYTDTFSKNDSLNQKLKFLQQNKESKSKNIFLLNQRKTDINNNISSMESEKNNLSSNKNSLMMQKNLSELNNTSIQNQISGLQKNLSALKLKKSNLSKKETNNPEENQQKIDINKEIQEIQAEIESLNAKLADSNKNQIGLDLDITSCPLDDFQLNENITLMKESKQNIDLEIIENQNTISSLDNQINVKPQEINDNKNSVQQKENIFNQISSASISDLQNKQQVKAILSFLSTSISSINDSKIKSDFSLIAQSNFATI